MDKYLFYALNVVAIALPLALFEIAIEKNKGWGSGWDKDKWYAKPFAPGSALAKLTVRVLHTEPPLNYHMVVFALVVPAVLIAEAATVARNGLLLLAVFGGILVFEDLFWFMFNWHFPGSFKELLKGPHGSIWWHKKWVRISRSFYLPGSYFTALPVSIILLLIA